MRRATIGRSILASLTPALTLLAIAVVGAVGILWMGGRP
jgi:hypothetical protein